jgi:hypothetical protein
MADMYTKAVLTVIAGALVALVVQRAFEPAIAQGISCGIEVPCKVETYYRDSRGRYHDCYSTSESCFTVDAKRAD